MIFSARSFLQCTGKEPRSGSGSGWIQCPPALPSENESSHSLAIEQENSYSTSTKGLGVGAVRHRLWTRARPHPKGRARVDTGHPVHRPLRPLDVAPGTTLGNSQEYKSQTGEERLTRDCQSLFGTQQGQSKQNRVENRISAPSPPFLNIYIFLYISTTPFPNSLNFATFKIFHTTELNSGQQALFIKKPQKTKIKTP